MKKAIDSLIREALGYQADAFENDEAVNAADLLEWFAEWRQRVLVAISAASLHSEDSPCHRR